MTMILDFRHAIRPGMVALFFCSASLFSTMTASATNVQPDELVGNDGSNVRPTESRTDVHLRVLRSTP